MKVKVKPKPISLSLAQVTTPEQVRDRLALAKSYCQEAETWLARSEGVAKSALRDALICLAEVWLGKSVTDALALVRRLVTEQIEIEEE